jgi:hypothetical protein
MHPQRTQLLLKRRGAVFISAVRLRPVEGLPGGEEEVGALVGKRSTGCGADALTAAGAGDNGYATGQR